MTTTHLDPMGKLFLGEVDVFTIYNYDIVRTVIWTLPALKIKIKRELWARREGVWLPHVYCLTGGPLSYQITGTERP